MRITKDRLRTLIREELTRSLNEQDGETAVSGVDLSDRYAFNSLDVKSLAELLRDIGLDRRSNDERDGLYVEGLGGQLYAMSLALRKEYGAADPDSQDSVDKMPAAFVKIRIEHNEEVLDAARQETPFGTPNSLRTGDYPSDWAEPVYATMQITGGDSGATDLVAPIVKKFNSQNGGNGSLVRYNGMGQIRFLASDGVSDFPGGSRVAEFQISTLPFAAGVRIF